MGRLRTVARSLLTDAKTLLAHRPHWSREPVPTTDYLPLLTPDKQEVYRSLLAGEYGSRCGWGRNVRFSAVERAARAALSAAPRNPAPPRLNGGR